VLNLHKLVDNLLESASIEAGRFRVRPRPATLGDIIAEATATMQPLLDRHGQRLVVELPAAIPMVLADPRRVVQVLVNLLSNASNAQRGLSDSEITISAMPWRARPDRAGAGGRPGARHPAGAAGRTAAGPALCAPARWPDPNAPTGFGLGLSVVKAIVEGHGGQLGIDDRPAAAQWSGSPCLQA
jgi:two-component system, OmpR family, phosphate regulon sensor histidine kinase PhoR